MEGLKRINLVRNCNVKEFTYCDIFSTCIRQFALLLQNYKTTTGRITQEKSINVNFIGYKYKNSTYVDQWYINTWRGALVEAPSHLYNGMKKQDVQIWERSFI